MAGIKRTLKIHDKERADGIIPLLPMGDLYVNRAASAPLNQSQPSTFYILFT